MKKIKIKDKMFVFMLIVFIAIACSSIIALMRYNNNREFLIEEHKQIIIKCKSMDKSEATDLAIEYCNNMLASDLSEYNMEAYTAYNDYVMDFFSKYINEFIIPFIIIIGSSYYVTKYLRNRIILNDINRRNYKTIVKKLFLSSWKYALLIPMMLLISFIIILCFVGVNGFRIGLSSLDGTIFANNLPLYFLITIIQSFILSMIFINLNLIITSREHNYILAVIKSYIAIIGLELFFEIVINGIAFNVFYNDFFGVFNILSVYLLNGDKLHLYYLLIYIVMLLVSFILLFLCYKNKEKLIIASEKNDNKEEV